MTWREWKRDRRGDIRGRREPGGTLVSSTLAVLSAIVGLITVHVDGPQEGVLWIILGKLFWFDVQIGEMHRDLDRLRHPSNYRG